MLWDDDWRPKSAREIVDAEKPLFDYSRYVLQTIAVGLAGLTVGNALYHFPKADAFWTLGWCSVALCAGCFAFMLWKVLLVGWRLVHLFLPDVHWLEEHGFPRFMLATFVAICLFIFTATLAGATVLRFFRDAS